MSLYIKPAIKVKTRLREQDKLSSAKQIKKIEYMNIDVYYTVIRAFMNSFCTMIFRSSSFTTLCSKVSKILSSICLERSSC